MKLSKPVSVIEIAQITGAKLLGEEDNLVFGINEIHKVTRGDLTFVDHPKYYDKSLGSLATVILIDKEVEVPEGKTLLVVQAPFDAYDALTQRYLPKRYVEQDNLSPILGEGSRIEPNVTIAPEVIIGRDCYIESGAYIGPYTVIGDRVHIGPGTVIGSDAFYYKKKGVEYTKWHSAGRVVIEDDVDIGANCTVNRGVSGDTIIGKGSKLDCQIHLGHGVVIGKHCLLAAQVGISGKTIIGDECTIYGQVGIAQSLNIGSKTIILAKSGVSKDLEGGQTYFGAPAEPAREKYRELAALRMLPSWMKQQR